MSTMPAMFETSMGRIDAQITVANSADRDRAEAGDIALEEVRAATLERALVDTGATYLALPADVIALLGLRVVREVPIATAQGPTRARLYRNAELTLMGRTGTFDVLELPIGTPPLLGQIPLEALGVEPDLRNRRLSLLPEEPNDTYITVLMGLDDPGVVR